MPKIEISSKGDFSKMTKLLNKLSKGRYIDSILHKYGREGVAALAVATPVDTGKTASSWSYDIEYTNDGASIVWSNSNVVKGYANIAILLQYGHGTRNGGYVAGRDYINPAIQPLFDKMAKDIWREVTGV